VDKYVFLLMDLKDKMSGFGNKLYES